MKWEDWRASYEHILSDFSYDPGNEQKAREAGNRASASNPAIMKGEEALGVLRKTLARKCLVTGNAPSLAVDMDRLRAAGEVAGRAIIASDSSCRTLHGLGIVPDIIVTDLDGDVETEKGMNGAGSLAVVHFHGDNIARATEFTGSLRGRAIVTTQAGPTDCTFNFGGFTDGDRAVLLCEEFGAADVILAGFDFERIAEKGTEGDIKRRKLARAKSIVEDASLRGLKITYA